MTSQYDFTNNEWSDIASLPVLVGYAVARAEDSGRLGNYLEIRKLVQTITAKAPENAAQALIEAAGLVEVKDKIEEFEQYSPDLLGDVAVTACTKIAAVLADRAEPDEARAFKEWVFDIAHQIARTAKEDGIRVSPPEVALLDRTKAALGV